MIKNKDGILQEKTEKLYAHVKSYLDEMDNLSDSDDFTMDNIERMWGTLEDTAKQIIREINEDMISAMNEKQMIKVKKRVFRTRNNFIEQATHKYNYSHNKRTIDNPAHDFRNSKH